jgi:spore coat polysaccharide biosynthesis protein SpsF
MGSTRLPGKVLRDIGGKSMLEHVLERARAACELDKIVVATTENEEDDEIERVAEGMGITVFRGSEHDVLDRYYQAAKAHGANPVVRLTADCPLLDPDEVDRVVRSFAASPDLDYLGTGKTYPEGYGTEVFTYEALQRAWEEASLSSEREHVTSYIWDGDDRFVVGRIELPHDRSEIRVTVDRPVDVEVVTKIINDISTPGELIGIEDVFAYLEKNSEIASLNGDIPRMEGYKKSVRGE